MPLLARSWRERRVDFRKARIVTVKQETEGEINLRLQVYIVCAEVKVWGSKGKVPRRTVSRRKPQGAPVMSLAVVARGEAGTCLRQQTLSISRVKCQQLVPAAV